MMILRKKRWFVLARLAGCIAFNILILIEIQTVYHFSIFRRKLVSTWQSSLRSWRNCYARVTFLPRSLNLRIRHGGLFIIIFNSTVRSGLLIAWSVPGVQIVVTGQKDVSRKKIRGCGDVRSDVEWERDVMWCGVRATELSPSLPLFLLNFSPFS